ncbi:protein phosphatase 2C domain-containing protein [Longispora albida]|uniref:protein phosphatase 2C domain-containing protein n=1 Tax=Longispora albida TaxID=203523 RepID=UPI000475EA34|nr:protein phosphatase 2C domain-containing protein [Longispora albida]
MLETTTVTEAAPGGVNDDLLLVSDRWAILLDGVSRYPGADNGCTHDVSWFVAHLGAHLGRGIATAPSATDMRTLLADAITLTMADHGAGCDLTNPLTPAATVAAIRLSADRIDWLVLGDATVSWLSSDGTADAVTDDRLEQLKGGPVVVADVRRYDSAYVASVRNKPGGFWVAAADPNAAAEALTGSVQRDRVAKVGLYSDGITRLVERYGRTWRELFDLAEAEGPRALVDAVRAAEKADPDPSRWRGKPHDDATAVIARCS